jgi:hypothetical protein
MDRSTFLKLSSISAISSLNGLMTLADDAIKKHLVMTKDLSTNRKQSCSFHIQRKEFSNPFKKNLNRRQNGCFL